MNNLRINQILAALEYGDAIGNEALAINELLRSWGYKSKIYADGIHPKLVDMATHSKKYKKSSSEDLVIFHFSIGSEVSKFVKTLPDKKIIIYHNITPPHFFWGINDSLVYLLRKGREELAEFADITDLALGVSEYNRRELVDLGFKNTGVLPLLIDFNKYAKEPDQRVLAAFDDDYINLVFVGRIVPNKRDEDIIKMFYYFNKYIEPRSRLILVGSYKGMDRYYSMLQNLVSRLNLNNVYMTGHVSLEELIAYYKVADVFVSMSEHEGFCVPLLESMYFGVPILAYSSSAIPDTLSGSGVLLKEKRYEEAAEMAYLLATDADLRDKIIRKQRTRLRDFDAKIVEAKLKKYIEEVIS
ncbi:MAG TPA: glycosyltransferase family 4 protein [Methanotrichaceae archaeon]|nr:glycosyltransferase family 4 protein [Methanotrichaceae archaeon]